MFSAILPPGPWGAFIRRLQREAGSWRITRTRWAAVTAIAAGAPLKRLNCRQLDVTRGAEAGRHGASDDHGIEQDNGGAIVFGQDLDNQPSLLDLQPVRPAGRGETVQDAEDILFISWVAG